MEPGSRCVRSASGLVPVVGTLARARAYLIVRQRENRKGSRRAGGRTWGGFRARDLHRDRRDEHAMSSCLRRGKAYLQFILDLGYMPG